METEKEIRARMRTNRDRLREMSNHELAEVIMYGGCRCCNYRDTDACVLETKLLDGNEDYAEVANFCRDGVEIWLSSEEEKR